jgi:hypothetical protein
MILVYITCETREKDGKVDKASQPYLDWLTGEIK